jgi:hypothetical protein
MNDGRPRLTLDRPVMYQIKVPGHLDNGWSDWQGRLKVEIVCEEDAPPVTTLTGTFDQAGLQGLLRRLYSLGLPLISVIYVEGDSEDNPRT